ncbi:LysR family transcriptional regulator [uncultured Paraglaciecola sp.]|uniref:LysR family transcriptional regulator n=1 Tax=uncultured Paraglaciecola sp. TaxID=1765024 RepID=UPI002625E7D3|nr:LysR family transcriptional regulator [uncultured Paraglaciecola sp.]
MDVRFLATFLEVAQTRHFGKAAENLYLTQSAISARIRLLEEYFNTSLFIRNRNSIRLTSAGEKLIPYAESLSATLSDARKALNEVDVNYLVCGATPNACELFLNDALIQMSVSFPDLSIRAEMLNTEQLSRQLHERVIDIAFSTEPLKSDDVENVAINLAALGLYSTYGTQHEESLQNYVHIDWGVKISESFYQLFPMARRAAFKSSSLSIVSNYIRAKGGAVLLTENLAKELNLSKIIGLEETREKLTVTTYLVYLKDIKNTALSELINFYRLSI